MKLKMFCRCFFVLTAAALVMGSLISKAIGDPLDNAIQTSTKQVNIAVNSQNKVDKLSDATRRMLNEYKQNVREAEVLKKYNDHLRVLTESQEAERQSLEKQLGEIEITQREIVPLISKMLENLEAFVGFDIAFLPEERQQRINNLKEMMVRADVTNAEKYRRVLEAYQIENEYGRTIEAYRADLSVDGVERPVDFLRLGRVALFYQTLDGSSAGMWNPETNVWDVLPGEYLKPVRNGLRIARKEAAPDLLTLPVPLTEVAK